MRSAGLLVIGVSVLALAVALGLALLPAAEPATRAAQAAQLASELRCPDCQALSVAESHTAASEAIRAEIDDQLAAGRSMDEVRATFVARYGEWILLAPRGPLPWLTPLLFLLLGGGVLLTWLGRSSGRRATDGGAGPSADALARVRREAEELDA